MKVDMKKLMVAVTLSAAISIPAVASAQEVVVVQDPGGAFGDALRRHVFTPFEKKTGIKVMTVQESRGGPRVKAQIEAGKTEWDMTFIFDQEVSQLADCCLSKIDYDKMDDTAKKTVATLPKNGVREQGVALQVIGVGLAYRTDVYKKEQPKTWADFWDVKKFPGKRCLPSFPRFVMEAALLADGVAKDKVYPIDVPRALKKIEEIKPHVVKWWQTGSQGQQLLLDGEASMCMAYSGRVFDLAINENAPVDMSWEGAFSYFDFFSIPKNAPHAANALKLIAFRLDPQVGAKLAEEIGYPVPSPLVYDAADTKKRRFWANNPEVQSKMVEWSASYWGGPAEGGRTNEEVLQEKLNAVLAK